MADTRRLSKLLEQANQLKNQTEQSFILKSGAELLHNTQNLAEKYSLDSSLKNKANILLVKNGVDTEKLDRKLADIDLKVTPTPSAPASKVLSTISPSPLTVSQLTETERFLADTDLEDYLKQYHQMILLSVIEESKKETETQFSRDCAAKLELDWMESKKEFLKELGQRESEADRLGTPHGGRVPNTPGFATPSTKKFPSHLASPIQPPPSSMRAPFHHHHYTPSKQMGSFTSLPQPQLNDGMITRKYRYFAEEVKRLITSRKLDRKGSIIDNFIQVTNETEMDTNRKYHLECWYFIKKLVSSLPVYDMNEVEYLNNLDNDKEKHHLLKVTRNFLEELFLNDLSEEIREAGGNINNMFPKDIVDRYLEINNSKDDWMKIYYYVRIGQIDSAVRLANNCGFAEAPILEEFMKQREGD